MSEIPEFRAAARNSSPRPESAFLGSPPLAGVKACSTGRKVPEFRPWRPEFLPSSRVRFSQPRAEEGRTLKTTAPGAFSGQRRAATASTGTKTGTFDPISLILGAELVKLARMWPFPPAVGREACTTSKRAVKVTLGDGRQNGLNQGPDDRIGSPGPI